MTTGALFGIAGALCVYLLRHRQKIGQSAADSMLTSIAQNLAVNFMLGMAPGVDNWGHLGGLIGGALAACLLGP